MADIKTLYLTALLPPDELAQRERFIKERIAEKYGTKVAITKPAHVTVIGPMGLDEAQLKMVDSLYTEQATLTAPFEMQVDGYGHFGDRVVYLNVEHSKEADRLYQSLKLALIQGLDLGPEAFKHKHLTPHMTLAYRDLTPETFKAIWEEYGKQEFTASFPADRLHLMRYENKRWVKFREYLFITGT